MADDDRCLCQAAAWASGERDRDGACYEVLRPIWSTKSETASRLRGRIEKILDAAKTAGYREGENPARWAAHLEHLLPKRKKLTRGHHAAMPYEEVPAYVQTLRKRETIVARALEFHILTAARPGMVENMRLEHIDWVNHLWVIPAAFMKVAVDHVVPLVPRAMEILRELKHTSKKGICSGAPAWHQDFKFDPEA